MVVFEHRIQVREYHLDLYMHVNHATTLSLLEDARWEMCNLGGFGIYDIQRRGVGPVILEANIRYKKELKLREHLLIKTWSDWPPQNKIGKVFHTIEVDGTNSITTECELKIGVMDLKERKLMIPPADWLKTIGVEP